MLRIIAFNDAEMKLLQDSVKIYITQLNTCNTFFISNDKADIERTYDAQALLNKISAPQDEQGADFLNSFQAWYEQEIAEHDIQEELKDVILNPGWCPSREELEQIKKDCI